MKRCHFNNWLAKLILAKNYTAITLFFNSFFKYDEEVYEWDNINHECIHQVQQIECFILGLIIGIIVAGLGAPWWIIPIMAFGFFYLWYGIEYLIIFTFAGWDKQNDRYHDVSFEEEAHSNDTEWDYLKERLPFSWMSYIKLRSYKK